MHVYLLDLWDMPSGCGLCGRAIGIVVAKDAEDALEVWSKENELGSMRTVREVKLLGIAEPYLGRGVIDALDDGV